MPVTSSKFKPRRHTTSGVQQGSKPAGHKSSKLRFLKGNAKLSNDVHTFSLPSGHTCPGACECLAKVDMTTGRLKDGPDQKFRCFSASQEQAFPSVRMSRRFNFQMLRRCRTSREIRDLLLVSLPKSATHVRVHVAGDFYSRAYFDAWMQVAVMRPKVRFYAYTKSVHFWAAWTDANGQLPRNFCLTASLGGKFDRLVRGTMVTAKVVFSPREAKVLGLPVDHDDSHAQNPVRNFSLIIHGIQAPGSAAGAAQKAMRQAGVDFGYRKA